MLIVSEHGAADDAVDVDDDDDLQWLWMVPVRSAADIGIRDDGETKLLLMMMMLMLVLLMMMVVVVTGNDASGTGDDGDYADPVVDVDYADPAGTADEDDADAFSLQVVVSGRPWSDITIGRVISSRKPSRSLLC